MSKTAYTLDDWNAICDVCGFKFKASQLRKRWDGAMVCKADYEERHPGDFLRARPDNQAVPWTRREQADRFVVVAEANPDEL